jgi:hypothetical protein
MTTILAGIGAGAWGLVVLRWLRLVWFRSKTLRVVTVDLDYQAAVPGIQASTFNAITRDGRKVNWNEYDAAISFVLSQLHLLWPCDTAKSRRFWSEKLGRIKAIIPKSTVGGDLVAEFVTAHL